MPHKKEDKRIKKLEEKFEALCQHLKLDVVSEYNEEDEYFHTRVVKAKKYPWQ